MKERIKDLRKQLRLTQAEFGGKIALSGNFVWMLEKGERIPSDRTIADICRVFNVNETWLRTGEGEMFVTHTRDEAIAAFVGRVLSAENDSFQKRLISVLAGLKEDEWELLEKVALHLAEGIKKD